MATDTSDAADPVNDLGEKLFSFVVYTDSHVNQSEHESMSPHEVNKLANGRHRHVLNEINRIAPEFAIHLGDLVHPVPVMGIYADAAERFHEQVSELECPLHLIPGNHDVGDKPIKWGPAEIVSDKSLELWEKHFGPHFHCFDHGNCKFVLLNAQIVNSGLAAESEQREWLERELGEAGGKRIFVCIHYPPYVFRPDELEYYDNIAEPGRSWLLALFERHKVEAVFSGHVHNFWYHRQETTRIYILPSITFVRHDYSEMYRVPAGVEAGRNDAAKLGYYIVDVHESGHVCHPIRTNGQILAPDAPKPAKVEILQPVHPLQNAHTSLGIDLRQPWAEVVQIQPSGGLDEFARKIVRNDYPLLALWEMGIRRLRLPLQDLTDPQVRSRMADLRDLGMGFTAFSFELPEGNYRAALMEHSHLLDGWEVGFDWSDFDAIRDGIKELKGEAPMNVFLTKLRSKEDLETDGQTYYHVINHGFAVSDRKVLDGLLKDNANRVAETLAASLASGNLTSYLDTLADADRGYFVHTGLVDRRFNPRLGLTVVRHLHGALSSDPGPFAPVGKSEFSGGCSVAFRSDGATYLLVLPHAELESFAAPGSLCSEGEDQDARLIDLSTGIIADVQCQAEADGKIRIVGSTVPPNPVLLIVS
jgi:3',5'-cyclic AMP phosphodiesterase CpdA